MSRKQPTNQVFGWATCLLQRTHMHVGPGAKVLAPSLGGLCAQQPHLLQQARVDVLLGQMHAQPWPVGVALVEVCRVQNCE